MKSQFSLENTQSSTPIFTAVQFVTEKGKSKSGPCSDCQSYSGNIYLLKKNGMHDGPVLPLHPNCCCHYQYLTDEELKKLNSKKISQMTLGMTLETIFGAFFLQSEPGKTIVHMRVKGSPGKFGDIPLSFGDIEFDGFEDMIRKLEERFKPGSIDMLIISNHGGLEGFYPMVVSVILRTFVSD